MDELRKQVRRAQWWLGVQRFVACLGWCLFLTLLVAVALILVDKYWPLGLQAWVWPAAALGLGLAAAIGWAIFRSRGAIDAAIEIDRRFGLKERVSSTLAMSDEERESEIGQALVDDALHRVERLDVRERFAVSPGRQLLLPLAPAILALLAAILVNPATDNPAEGMTDPLAVKQQIENANKSLQMKLSERREEARKEGLKDAQTLLTKLQKELDNLDPAAKQNKQEAMVKLNDLAKQLEKRSQELGGAEGMQRQLEQLKDIEKGPADKFLREVRRGNVEKAIKELKDLKEQLANGKLNAQQQKNLANQLGQMQRDIEKIIKAHQEAIKDVEKRIAEARQAGKPDEVKKLQEQKQKLQAQLPQMKNLQNMAGKLGQAAQNMKDGQLKDAAAMLDGMAGEMKDLDQQLKEFELMQQALEQLEQARKQMGCKACNGAGCGKCNGPPGIGMGEGRGIGPRPEQEHDTSTFNTQAATKATPGAADYAGQVEGPNEKGDLLQGLGQENARGAAKEADPLADLRIPRKHHQHVEEYFNQSREGK